MPRPGLPALILSVLFISAQAFIPLISRQSSAPSSTYRISNGGLARVYAATTEALKDEASKSSDRSATSGAVAPPTIPGMWEQELDDPNEYYESEPPELTKEQLQALTDSELSHVMQDGRTLEQWLKEERPTFTDGGLVADWVYEAQRLRLLPFIERAEHFKSLSFDDVNLFRFRQCEWQRMMEDQGVLPREPDMKEEGVVQLTPEAHQAKLDKARDEYGDIAEREKELMRNVDSLLSKASFEGSAMDGTVRVTMSGRFAPLECTVEEGALKDARILGQGIESAMSSAYRQATQFYEETISREYLEKAESPTDLESIAELLGDKQYKVVADVIDPEQEKYM